MTKISRFSKPVRPAEFNPMTADEIMRVPLLKGQLEQEQLQAIEDKRLALLNIDVAPGDMERVRAEQARMTGQFDNLVNKITSEGVSHQSTDAINKFMREYNNVTSKSGLIGNAAQFAADRKLKREQDRQLAIQRGYDMNDWEKLYNLHETKQQSVDSEGNFVTEFQNINLPNHIDPKKLFREIAKEARGSIKQGTTLGEYTESNKVAVQAALDQVIQKYQSDPEYRAMLETLGYDEERFINELTAESDMILKEANIKYQESEADKARRLKLEKDSKEEEKAAFDKYGERILAADKGAMERSDIRKDDKEIQALKDAYEMADDGPEKDSARMTYLRALAANDEITNLFETEGGGAQWKAEEEAAKSVLMKGQEAIDSGTIEEMAKLLDEKYTVTTPGIQVTTWGDTISGPSTKERRAEIVQGDDGTYHLYATDSPEFQRFKEARDKYQQEFDNFAGPDKLHAQREFLTVSSTATGGSSDTKTNDPILGKLSDQLTDVILGESGSNKVASAIGSYTDDDGNNVFIEKKDKYDLSLDEKVKRYLNRISKNDVQNIKFAMPTDTRAGTVRFSFTVKEPVDGVERDVTYDVDLDMLGDETSEWGIFQSQGLGGMPNEQAEEILKAERKRAEYSDIIPVPYSRKEAKYDNTKEINKKISKGVIGSRFTGKGTSGIQVVNVNGKYGMRRKLDNSVEIPVANKDVYNTFTSAKELSFVNPVLRDKFFKHITELVGPIPANSAERETWQKVNEAAIEAEFQRLAKDNYPFVADSKIELMEIMSKDGGR